jgi:hypothetical protein
MPMLMATCPRCRSEVNTCLSADERTMQELGPKLQVLVLCDDCCEYQKMMVRDMYIASDAIAA